LLLSVVHSHTLCQFKCEAVCESFIIFYDVNKDPSAAAVSDLVVKELKEFDGLNKLIAQTYDGAAVMPGELNGVQAKVKEYAPDAIFIHCHAHRLNLVLSQVNSSNGKWDVFFSTLGGLSTSFTTSSKRMSLLDGIVKTRFPKLVPTRWSYSARLVETVQHNLKDLLQLFEHIVETPQSFDQKSINETQRFLLTLSGFDFNILLQIYGSASPFTQNLYNILQSKSMEILFCFKEI